MSAAVQLQQVKQRALTVHRSRIVMDTAARFLMTTEGMTNDWQFWLAKDRLKIAISEQLISRFSIVLTDNGQAVAKMFFVIDYYKHNAVCDIEELVPVDGIEEGKTFPSIHRIIDVAQEFLSAGYEACDNPDVEIWHTYSDVKDATLGRLKIREMLSIAFTEEEDERMGQRWQAHNAALANAQRKSTVFPDLPEAHFGLLS